MKPTLENRPHLIYDPTEQDARWRALQNYFQEGSDWFESFEKKHREFAVEGKIYDWLDENVPNWAEKGCKYMDILILFIRKEVLGEVAKEA